MVKAVFNVVEFAKSMLSNCIKMVRLKPDQPNQWLRACLSYRITIYIWTNDRPQPIMLKIWSIMLMNSAQRSHPSVRHPLC